MEEDAEKKKGLVLKQELQRVRILMEVITVDDDDDDLELRFTDSAIHTLSALKDLKLKQSDERLIALKNIGIQQPPQEFLCPISGLLMRDPVVADSGQTYDFTSIQKRLREGNKNCPVTGEELHRTFLTANHIVKDKILSWCKESQVSFFQEMEKRTVLELKTELQRLTEGLVTNEDDGDSEFIDDVFRTLYGLRESKLRQEPPQEFLCPISGILMIDPVVAASGQTFDESHIEKWLKQGNTKCPKSDELLPHTLLIPNHLIKEMIAKWCKASQVDPPSSRLTGDEHLTADAPLLDLLIEFPSPSHSHQMARMKHLRLLTARLPSFRALCGNISPLLTPLMIQQYNSDAALYNEAVATILNISIDDTTKVKIVSAIPFLIEALRGLNSVEIKGHAAAALCELSAVDSNKLVIGEAGAVGPLIQLLELGHPLASREAASAVLSLCTRIRNRERALSEGGLLAVIDKLDHPQLLDVMLEILALFSSHTRAVEVMVERGVLPRLFRVIRETRSARDEENSLVIICAIGSTHKTRLRMIERVENALKILYGVSNNGSARARRKAIDLLLRMRGEELAHVKTN